MRNHPANKLREQRNAEGAPAPAELGAGAAILAALEGADVLERPDVYALGMRQKITPATARAPERVYTLDAYAVRPAAGAPSRFYVLSGGASAARTVLDSAGSPIAHAERAGRGFSPAFREWIAGAVESDAERAGF